jgi:hypothetical protein
LREAEKPHKPEYLTTFVSQLAVLFLPLAVWYFDTSSPNPFRSLSYLNGQNRREISA